MTLPNDKIDVRLELPAELDLLWPLDAFTRELLLGVRPTLARKAVDDVLLVLHEAFTNVCKHAYDGKSGGRVIATVRVRDDTIEILLEDTGKSFKLEDYQEPDMNRMLESGRGIWLMKQLTDDFFYTASPEGLNTLRLVKRFKRDSET